MTTDESRNPGLVFARLQGAEDVRNELARVLGDASADLATELEQLKASKSPDPFELGRLVGTAEVCATVSKWLVESAKDGTVEGQVLRSELLRSNNSHR